MRYLGNKDSIILDIFKLLSDKGVLYKNLTFFDAFCGTGAVSDALKELFHIKANDLLLCSSIYTQGRVCANDCTFATLGFNPFDFFNSDNDKVEGFFYQNYSPGGSARMYFSQENAARIDYFRTTIEGWKNENLIVQDEYCYLLACLMESVSAVANTAGVYGAFLKHWDARALKSILFIPVNAKLSSHKEKMFYNDRIEDIISDVACDILYMDPPYTQNQYGTQYHLLETLVRYDAPEISKITGSRSTAPLRSEWSKEHKVNITFDSILAKTQARYIVLSYSNDGFLTPDFIEASLKRYGKPDTYECRKISYKKYQNFKSKNEKEHFEYLFFIEKKPIEEVVYESPLNYTGSKIKMISEIKQLLPACFNSMIDAFGGGFNVGINIQSGTIVYNDINCYVKELIESFKTQDTYQYILYIKQQIRKFGLEPANKDSYHRIRDYYNRLPIEKRDPRLLFTLILYGFQQQIRFNGNHDFNNPVGMRWFNEKLLEKMISFSRKLKENDYQFACSTFETLCEQVDRNTFVYMDPPYRLTLGSYNDGKRGFEGWTMEHERLLFKFADEMNHKGAKFMLSYVQQFGEQTNDELNKWIDKRGYVIHNVEALQGRYKDRKEIIVTNY